MFPPAQNSVSTSARQRSSDSPEFVAVMARAYTLSEIFPLHHPTVLDAMRDVADGLQDLEATVVKVTRTELIEAEHPIADPHGHLREFARDLSLAGVSELGLSAALDLEQIERFLRSLRVITEDPDLALDDFLAQEGGCSVELALHGGELRPVPTAFIDETPVADPTEVDSFDAPSPEIEHDEIERIEPLREWTVEEEIEEELLIEPLGAHLSTLAVDEPVFEPVAEPEDGSSLPTSADVLEIAEVPETTAQPDEAAWRSEVRARLLVLSQVDPIEPTDDTPLTDRSDDRTVAMEVVRELPDVDMPAAVAVPAVPVPLVDSEEEIGYSEADLPMVDSGSWDGRADAELWGGAVEADADHLAELEQEPDSPLQELYDTPDPIDAHEMDEVPLAEVAQLSFASGASAPTNGAVTHLPLVPVLDESEIDSPTLVVPPDTHVAAPEEVSTPATVAAVVAPGALSAEPPQALRAALGDAPAEHPEPADEAEADDSWKPTAEDDTVSLWDAEAAEWMEDGEGPSDSPSSSEMEEQFPPVEELAPDGPALLEGAAPLEAEPEDGTYEAPVDPEIALLESGLAAEAPQEPLEPEPELPAAPEPDLEPVPDDSQSFSALVSSFVGAQEVERPMLHRQLLDEAAQLAQVRDFGSIALGIETLVRDALPGDHSAIALARTLAEPPVINALCSVLAEVRDPDRRDELVYVFGQLSELTAPALAKDLSEVPPRAARRNYMDALFGMRTEAVAVAVPMLDDSRWFIVRNGVDILGEAGDEGAVARLAPSLAHPDHRVRRATVTALAKLGGARAGNELIPVLEDPNAEVREGAAMALGHLRVAKALRPMLELLERDKDDDAQLVILRSLGQIGDPGAVPAIEKRAVGFFFIKPSKAVRIAAYRALAAIGTPHASRLVRDAVDDRDAEVAVAAQALAVQLGSGAVAVVEPV